MAIRGKLFHRILPAGDIFCISISIEFYLAPRLSLPLHASSLFPPPSPHLCPTLPLSLRNFGLEPVSFFCPCSRFPIPLHPRESGPALSFWAREERAGCIRIPSERARRSGYDGEETENGRNHETEGENGDSEVMSALERVEVEPQEA